MTVKLGDIISKISKNVDRFNTPLEYYIGKGLGECGELALTQKGDLKKDVELLGYQFQFEFQKGDTLFFTKSHHLKKAGIVDFDGVCSIATFVLRSKDNKVLLPEYLPIIIHNDDFWDYCIENESGSVNTFVRWSTLAAYEVNLPSIEEQKSISEKIWAAYRLKESYRKLLAATDDMVKAKFVEMFRGKENWTIEKLKDIVHPDCPVSYGIVQPGDELQEGIPIVRPVDLNDRYYVYREGLKKTSLEISNSYKRTILRGDELLMCVRGTTGVMGIASSELKGCNVTRGITPLYFKEGYNRFYILCAFLSDDVQKFIKDNTVGSTLKGINMAIVREIGIPIPPMDLQIEFEKVFVQSEATKASLRQSIESIDRVIKSLINQ